jgi:hypothetical protein
VPDKDGGPISLRQFIISQGRAAEARELVTAGQPPAGWAASGEGEAVRVAAPADDDGQHQAAGDLPVEDPPADPAAETAQDPPAPGIEEAEWVAAFSAQLAGAPDADAVTALRGQVQAARQSGTITSAIASELLVGCTERKRQIARRAAA